MEKSSEKVIASEKLAINPFNNLLSEVQIKINQPKSSKKIDNYVLHIDSNIDKSNSNLNYFPKEQKKHNALQTQSKKNHNNVYVINAPLKTKHSSDTLIHQNKQRQIIAQWIIGFMSKRHILGTHWEHNLEGKKHQFVRVAFNKIKYYKQKIKGEDSFEAKVVNFVQIFQFMQNCKIKQAFSIVKEFYKDDQLFGLSNTIKENNSLMLKIESDYQSVSVSSPKFKKEPKRQQFASNSSSSYNPVTKKRISESGEGSEDLSALILNHNQLKFSEQLNRSNPNIPKAKNSQKNIKTHQQITELSLQTRKMINSQRKLSDEHRQEELPLQSNKRLKKTKKELMEQANTNEDKSPVTLTYVMNNLNLTQLINNKQQSKAQQKTISISKKSIDESLANKAKQQTIKEVEFDQNIINKLPFAESFYQPQIPHSKNGLVTFIHQQNPKRSTSLQIKYNNPISFQKNEKNNYNNISNKNIFNQEYYPQENNRENQHFIQNSFQIPIQKIRPKSATPKITFTFSNSTSNLHRAQIPSIISMNKQYQHPQYDQKDCVLQSIINAQPQPVQIARHVEIQQKHNKLQVISPSRRPQSPKRTVPPTKIGLNNRQHIKNNILPPFNDYYQNQKSQKQPNPNLKILFNDNQLVYNDNFQKSTAQNSLFSPRQSNSNRVKSPKDKIFVTYTTPRNY